MVYARTEHLQTAFARQRIVYSEQDGITQKRHDESKHHQTELVFRSAGSGKKPMVGRIMLLT